MNENTTTSKIWAVVPAAGVGSRMGADKPKQYLQIKDKTIIEHTLERLFQLPLAGLVVCKSPQDDLWERLNITHPRLLASVDGGETRAHSVLNGLRYLMKLAEKDDWVLVHDAARPAVSEQVLQSLVDELREHEVGGLLAVPVHDTVKLVAEDNTVEQTLDRNQLWYAQTPQMFRFGLLLQALESAIQYEKAVTDEASAVELMGLKPKLVVGEISNIKVTIAADMKLVELFLES